MIRGLLGRFLIAGSIVVSLLTGCAPTGADQPPAGALRGELVVSIVDFADHTERRFDLREADQGEVSLKFEHAPAVAPGTLIDVWGTHAGQTLVVSRWAAAPAVSSWTGALLSGVKKPPRRWAFVMVDIGGGTVLSKVGAQQKLFSDRTDSIRSYYREVSYGLQDLDGDVLGPLPYAAGADSAGLCNNFQDVGAALRPMITGQYDQYLYFFGTPIRACDWGGVATLGTAARPSSDSYYNATADCGVLVQEPGHNFGMVHSSALRCTRNNAPVSMIVPDDGSCIHDEYGNVFDPMGGGNPGTTQMLTACYHMNGVQKAYQDWLTGCNIVKATSSGTFTIYPIEKPCDGVQMLQVPLPAPRTLKFPPSPIATLTTGTISSYYLELRTPIGLDKGLKTPRVFVVAAGELKDARLRGNPNWLIDMTPTTQSVDDAALAVGSSFTDPAPGGPKFSVVSADATKAVIKVELGGVAGPDAPGAGTCSDDTAFKAPGPTACAAAPFSASDGGVPPTPGRDAGSSMGGSPDGGAPPVVDASTSRDTATPMPRIDAIVRVLEDAAPSTPVIEGAGTSGCHCNLTSGAPPTGAWLWVALAGLVGWSRRRRR